MKNYSNSTYVLRIKKLVIAAGRPIVFLNKKTAAALDISIGDKIAVYFKNKKTIGIVDLIQDLLSEEEISLSEEVLSYLGAKAGEKVEVGQVPHPKSLPFIMKKMKGIPIKRQEIKAIIEDIVSNTLAEAEIAYFISAIYEQKMSLRETIYLTQAVYETGSKLNWGSRHIADKHSIGGVPGNRTTPIIVSICASAGIIMPKTSSRAITSAAGTADVVETLTHVDLSLKQLQLVVKKTNACLAWGGSIGLAPADDKLIKVGRLLRVDPEAQLISSIMAKKLAAGSTHVLIDIPFGKGAKVSLHQAKSLEKKFHKVARHFGMHIKVVITEGSSPIGNGIGPNLEMKNVLSVLQRQNAPKDLEQKSIMLSGLILEMLGKSPVGRGERLAVEILNSGLALQKFDEIIEAQGRKRTSLSLGPYSKQICSVRNGKISFIDNQTINNLGRILGCPADKASGIYINKDKSSRVLKGEPIFTIYSESDAKLQDAISFLKTANPFTIS